MSFVVNDNFYVGTGHHDNYVASFYKYNPNNDEWTSVADHPGGRRTEAIAFSIGDYGYTGLGYLFSGGLYTHYDDLWKYDPLNDQWSQMADFPGYKKNYLVCFVIDDKAYVLSRDIDDTTKLWMYDSLTDTWSQKANYPGGCYTRGTAFTINNKGYVGFGFTEGICDDLWEYDPSSDTWTAKNNFPGKARYGAVAFVNNNEAYVACGFSGSATSPDYLNDLWIYDDVTDSWTQLETDYPGNGRMNMVAGVINNTVYIGLGTNNSGGSPSNRFSDIWALEL